MYKIKSAEFIGPDVKMFTIESPPVAKKAQAGQFIILRVHENGERIPLTIANTDPEAGLVTIIVQGIGRTTKELNMKNAGDSITDFLGPLGTATHIENWGTAVIVSGGVGTAEAYPLAKAMKHAGNKVISIIGARTADLVIADDLMDEVCDEVIITTNDGTRGIEGMVTGPLTEMLESNTPPNMILAVGPIPMMEVIAEMTRPLGIKTMVSLNAIMIDGTGMCGGCRATIGGETKFVCVDGPEFDGHLVDFKELAQRQKMYKNQERRSLDQFFEDCKAASETV